MEEEKWKDLDALLKGLENAVKTAALNTRTRSLIERVEALRADFTTTRAGSDSGARERIESAVQDLWAHVERWSGVAPRKSLSEWLAGFTFAGLVGLFALASVLVLFVVGVVMFTGAVGWKTLVTVEGTRPILTLAAIIATLTYGGGLIFSALFSSEGKFDERFRMAREIFLVFSGVFATIVGFHFGKQDNPNPDDTAAALQLEVKRGDKPGELSLSVLGGTPPYTVETKGSNINSISKVGQSPFSIGIVRQEPTKPFSVSFSVVDKSIKNKGEIAATPEVLQELVKSMNASPGETPKPDPAAADAAQPNRPSDTTTAAQPPVVE